MAISAYSQVFAIVAVIRAETRGLGDVLLGEEETSLARMTRGWRMRAIYAASTTAYHDRRCLLGGGLCLSRVRRPGFRKIS